MKPPIEWRPKRVKRPPLAYDGGTVTMTELIASKELERRRRVKALQMRRYRAKKKG